MMLEVLHGFLVGFSGASGFESAEVAALTGFGVFFARVQPVLA